MRKRMLPGLQLYLLVKRDNRKKHNSHEWFLKSFCDDIEATFAFCTDCGTYFNQGCLLELVKYLENHQGVAACCGRQRARPPQRRLRRHPRRPQAPTRRHRIQR